MAKNNYLIEKLKEAERQKRMYEEALVSLDHNIQQIVPEVYACFVLMLYRRNYETHRIRKMLAETGEIWQELTDLDMSKEKMVEFCENETGINVQLAVEDEE